MRPVRLAISIFFIIVFFLIWGSVRDGGPSGINFITVISFLAVILIVLFIVSLIDAFIHAPENKRFSPHRNKFYRRGRWFKRYYQRLISERIYFVDSELQNLPQNGLISENSADYIINKKDLERKNNYDSRYIDKNRKVLFYLYENICPLCQIKPCEHIDHFFVPKCKGGNLIMKQKNGELVNNAVPLCATCNLRKGNRSYTKFFSPSQIEYISHRNAIMTSLIRKYHT